MKKYKVLIFNPFTRETTWEVVFGANLDNAIIVAKYQNANKTKALYGMCNYSISVNDVVSCLITVEAKEILT